MGRQAGVGVEAAGGVPDAVKWVATGAIVTSGVVGFYYFADYSLLLRVVAFLVLAGCALAVAARTARGRVAWDFVRDSRTEVRKVVWPTRRETIQTTGIVIALVTLVAVIMWILDGMLSWIIRALLGNGG